MVEPLTFMFDDQGDVPNNPTLPVLLYRTAIDVAGAGDPESMIEQIFMANRWGHHMWRNGIYPYTHFHTTTHEALGVARGGAHVRLGGSRGQDLDLTAGDVVVLPAGTGHQRLSDSDGLSVIGGYPTDSQYDLQIGAQTNHDHALKTIARVPLPESDPLFGADGPLLTQWRVKT